MKIRNTLKNKKAIGAALFGSAILGGIALANKLGSVDDEDDFEPAVLFEEVETEEEETEEEETTATEEA